MDFEIAKNQTDATVAYKAAVLGFDLMNLDEFGYWRASVEGLGVGAAKLGAELTLATLREMGALKQDIDAEKFAKFGSAVVDRVLEEIMAERRRA